MILSNLVHEGHYLVRYRLQIRNRKSADPRQKHIRAIAQIDVILFDNEGEHGLSGNIRFSAVLQS